MRFKTNRLLTSLLTEIRAIRLAVVSDDSVPFGKETFVKVFYDKWKIYFYSLKDLDVPDALPELQTPPDASVYVEVVQMFDMYDLSKTDRTALQLTPDVIHVLVKEATRTYKTYHTLKFCDWNVMLIKTLPLKFTDKGVKEYVTKVLTTALYKVTTRFNNEPIDHATMAGIVSSAIGDHENLFNSLKNEEHHTSRRL